MGQDRQAALNRAIAIAQSKGIDVRTARFVDKTVYVNFDAKGLGGSYELVDSTTKKERGITNLDGNVLNKGKYVIIDSFRALGENTATEFADAKWRDELHPRLKNCDLSLVQRGVLIDDMPLTDVQNSGNSSSNDDDFRVLATAPCIEPELEYRMTLNFVKGQGVPSSVTSALTRLEFRIFEVFTA
ncbi:hypothetical protein [Flavobacterium sp. WV_118_3]|uniref:hypothetical protein n=1 Tax=Flavobacterium sp. WV_118_3 TaxID=3151764 RepID=UPI00321B25AE